MISREKQFLLEQIHEGLIKDSTVQEYLDYRRVVAIGYVGSRAQGMDLATSDHDVWLITLPKAKSLIFSNKESRANIKFETKLSLRDYESHSPHKLQKVQATFMDVGRFIESLKKPNIRCYEFLANNCFITSPAGENSFYDYVRTQGEIQNLFSFLELKRDQILLANIHKFSNSILGLANTRVKDMSKWKSRYEKSDKTEEDQNLYVDLSMKDYTHILRLKRILAFTKDMVCKNTFFNIFVDQKWSELYPSSELTSEFNEAAVENTMRKEASEGNWRFVEADIDEYCTTISAYTAYAVSEIELLVKEIDEIKKALDQESSIGFTNMHANYLEGVNGLVEKVCMIHLQEELFSTSKIDLPVIA